MKDAEGAEEMQRGRREEEEEGVGKREICCARVARADSHGYVAGA